MDTYQNKKNLPQFLRDFVSDSSYDESAEFASLKKQVAEEFINPTTRMFEDTRVYINEAGNPVIVFDKYEIAPGCMGSPEFKLPNAIAEF